MPARRRKMRMKLNKTGQLLAVSAASLLAAGLLTACGATNTVDYVYVASSLAAGSNSYGEIDVFEINMRSGFMRQIPASPFPSGGRDPVAEAVSTDYQNLYVVNKDDNSIVQFAIGTDGKLYPQNTVNTPGSFPAALAVTGSSLFVLDTYQPLNICSTNSPCSGSIAVFPIERASGTGSTATPSGALGAPLVNGGLDYWPLSLPGSNDIIQPTAITVLPSGGYLYVTAYDTTANAGYVFGFSVASDGTLTALNGGVPVSAGVQPSAIASDPAGSYVYVTDSSAGTVLGYSVSGGTLKPLTSGTGGGNTFAAGTQPSAIVVDPSGRYVYVTNLLDATVMAYSRSGGALTPMASYATGLQPVALGIDPALHEYLYTVNFLGSSVSDFEMDPTSGTLINAQSSPYKANALPTAAAAIPHGVATGQ